MLEKFFSSNIRHIRLTLGLSQQALGREIGVTGKTVGMWERGDVDFIKKGTLLALTNYFSNRLGKEVTREYLKTQDFSAKSIIPATQHVFPTDIPPHLPVISLNEAGLCQDYTSREYSRESDIETVPRPPDLTDKSAYALRINNDSMAPAIDPGDIFIVSPEAPLANNKIFVVRTSSEQVLVKRILRKGDYYYILKSANPNYEPELIKINKVAALHRVIWIKKE